MTLIKKIGYEVPYLAKEGYQTVKRRIYTTELFIELTIEGCKVCINKNTIEEFVEQPKEAIKVAKEDKKDIKKKL